MFWLLVALIIYAVCFVFGVIFGISLSEHDGNNRLGTVLICLGAGILSPILVVSFVFVMIADRHPPGYNRKTIKAP